MADNAYVEIDVPEANALADLTGFLRDLESARDFAGSYKSLRQGQTWDWQLADALTTAALVRYGRAFATGMRHSLRNFKAGFLSKLTPEQLEKHQRLIDFRDKHIAHSANAFEENIPVARYRVERVHTEGISSVECNSVSVSAMSVQDADDVIELTSALLVHASDTQTAEKARLLERI